MTKLTVKQQKYVQAKASGKTGIQAAMIAYDTTDRAVANAISSQNLQKPNIAQALEIALKKHGIDLDKAIRPIADGLEAEKMNEYTGEITIDHGTRLKASDRALKLMGIGKEEGGTTNYNFINVAAKDKEEFNL